jgi:predicted acylesterase/phospholipase RssA
MTSAAISVLQERCASLSEQLAAKDELEKALRSSLEETDEQHRLEMAGMSLELDSAKTSLKKEQSDKRALEEEKRTLIEEVASLKNLFDSKLLEAIKKSTAEFSIREVQLSEELMTCQLELQQFRSSERFKLCVQ